jgi:hypothetical protein
LETAIPKKPLDGKPTKSRLDFGARTPPPLSEELIAKLQGAVRAAQQKKDPQSGQPSDSNNPK